MAIHASFEGAPADEYPTGCNLTINGQKQHIEFVNGVIENYIEDAKSGGKGLAEIAWPIGIVQAACATHWIDENYNLSVDENSELPEGVRPTDCVLVVITIYGLYPIGYYHV